MAELNFKLAPGAYEWRPLKFRKRRLMKGWDVYALQTALSDRGYRLGPAGVDGIFGRDTREAVHGFQEDQPGLVVDEIAGGATQRRLGELIAQDVGEGFLLPDGVPHGHLERESTYILGNYTAPYGNGSRDVGITQRNTQYIEGEDKLAEGFKVRESVELLCQRTSDYYDKYSGDAYDLTELEAWRFACGAWNAPAFTDALARGATSVLVGGVRISLEPGASARVKIEDYMDAVTAYMVL